MQGKAEISVNGWLYWTGFVGKNTGVKSSWPCSNLCFLIVCACYDVYRGILLGGELGAPWALSVRGRALLVPGSGFCLFQTHTHNTVPIGQSGSEAFRKSNFGGFWEFDPAYLKNLGVF